MTAALVEALKTRLVAAELAQLGITDRAQVVAVAARIRVEDTGALVGLDANGNPGVGAGPGFTLSVADVARDLGAKAPADAPANPAGPNPFARNSYNVTAQMLLWRDQPEAAQRLADEAGFPMRGMN